VSGLCDAERHLDRFKITHLTDQNDVRILTQTGAQRLSE
jgi:hypothetical protein